LYLIAARALFVSRGEILYESAVISDDAKSLWSRLLINGWAETDDSSGFPVHRMNKAFLESMTAGPTCENAFLTRKK